MKKLQCSLIGTLLLAQLNALHASFPSDLDVFDTMIADMQESMDRMKQIVCCIDEEYKKTCDNTSCPRIMVNIKEDTKNNKVIVTINNMSESNALEATIYDDEDRLVVKGPKTIINVQKYDRHGIKGLTVTANHNNSKSTEKTEKNNQQSNIIMISSSSGTSNVIIENDMRITAETVHIAQDKKNNSITITIDTASKDIKGKKIPVTITNNEQKE